MRLHLWKGPIRVWKAIWLVPIPWAVALTVVCTIATWLLAQAESHAFRFNWRTAILIFTLWYVGLVIVTAQAYRRAKKDAGLSNT